jgi:hypothetical protein
LACTPDGIIKGATTAPAVFKKVRRGTPGYFLLIYFSDRPMASTLTMKSAIKKAKKGMEVNGINIAVSNSPLSRMGDYPPHWILSPPS